MRRLALPAATHAVLLLGAVVTLAPLAWMVGASLMQPGEANSVPPRLFPEAPSLRNYLDLFTRLDLARHFLNSVVVTTFATIVSVLGQRYR